MKKVSLKSMIVICMLVVFRLYAQEQVSSPNQANVEIEPYIDFLEKEKIPTKDYILSLFKEKDIVILCERDHRELTQYNLILDVINDPYFINNVGVVYTEIGDRNLNPALNTFLLNNSLDETEINDHILHFQRNVLNPLWRNSSFAHLVKGIYNLNKSLPLDKKVRLFPVDFMGILEDSSPENLLVQIQNQAIRDSLMADEFVKCYEEVKTSNKKKALVIMNSRHAFKHNIISENGTLVKNFGHFILQEYPGITTNIMIHNWRAGDNQDYFTLMQDGKWDSSFKYMNIDNIGFDFCNSPFGKDRLDYGKWLLANNTYTYQDIFDGFVFYQPIEKFEMAIGLEGLMEDGFYDEFIKRATALNNVMKREIFPVNNKEEIMKLNKEVVSPMNNLQKLQADIDGWFK